MSGRVFCSRDKGRIDKTFMISRSWLMSLFWKYCRKNEMYLWKMTTKPRMYSATYESVTVPVGRDKKIRTAKRTNQFSGFVTMPSEEKKDHTLHMFWYQRRERIWKNIIISGENDKAKPLEQSKEDIRRCQLFIIPKTTLLLRDRGGSVLILISVLDAAVDLLSHFVCKEVSPLCSAIRKTPFPQESNF